MAWTRGNPILKQKFWELVRFQTLNYGGHCAKPGDPWWLLTNTLCGNKDQIWPAHLGHRKLVFLYDQTTKAFNG